MILVLDLDGTLIGVDEQLNIHARHHLESFLDYAFHTFDHVGVWTAASREWYDKAYREVIGPILRKINRQFSFVWSEEKCTKILNKYHNDGFSMSFEPLRSIKKLSKLWRRAGRHRWGCTRHNTLVVDDNSSTFQQNYGNAIHIPSFNPMAFIGNDQDTHLQTLIAYFKDCLLQKYQTQFIEMKQTINIIDHDNILLIIESYAPFRSLRQINKRSWLYSFS